MSTPSLRGLVKDTAIYGLSSILGRVVGMIMIPLYTAVFTPETYVVQTLLYVYISFFMVFYVLRLDTAYFRYRSDHGRQVFDSAFSTIILVAAGVSFMINGAAEWLTSQIFNLDLMYVPHVRLMAMILFMDAAAEIPFAKLRYEQRAIRFASIRLVGIGLNIGLNLLLLVGLPYFIDQGWMSAPRWYVEMDQVQYIFISNALASLTVLLLLYPAWSTARMHVSRDLIRRMLLYALPLVVVSFAGLLNEMIDKVLLDRLLPFDATTNKHETGVYAAVYKFSILIALFTQSYRYAAEPFFFAHAKSDASPRLYGRMADYFTLFACFGMLCILFFMPYFAPIILRNSSYIDGLPVVPLLIAAQILLGIYYNLSVWYKLSDKTAYAMYIAIAGALITLMINAAFIPTYGYWASAWATLLCYAVMTVLSYGIGRRHYPLQHDIVRLMGYVLVSLALFYGLEWVITSLALSSVSSIMIKSVIILILAYLMYIRFIQGRSNVYSQ